VVELTAFTTIVAVLIASALLGVIGAILAVPFAAVIKIGMREAGRPRRERMTELRAAEEPPPEAAGPPDGGAIGSAPA
jgi:predicted PurR-regulated permease PerM